MLRDCCTQLERSLRCVAAVTQSHLRKFRTVFRRIDYRCAGLLVGWRVLVIGVRYGIASVCGHGVRACPTGTPTVDWVPLSCRSCSSTCRNRLHHCWTACTASSLVWCPTKLVKLLRVGCFVCLFVCCLRVRSRVSTGPTSSGQGPDTGDVHRVCPRVLHDERNGAHAM